MHWFSCKIFLLLGYFIKKLQTLMQITIHNHEKRRNSLTFLAWNCKFLFILKMPRIFFSPSDLFILFHTLLLSSIFSEIQHQHLVKLVTNDILEHDFFFQRIHLSSFTHFTFGIKKLLWQLEMTEIINWHYNALLLIVIGAKFCKKLKYIC